MKRIAVIGNAGGGKTTLSRKLGLSLNIPVFHVDSIQYQPKWQKTPQEECDHQLNELVEKETWIIDGFGNKEIIKHRLEKSDTVIFVDFPIWLHYWWAIKRQLKSGLWPRKELPENCPEFSLSHTWRLFKIMWKVYKEYTPWFRSLICDLPQDAKIFHIRSKKEWGKFSEKYFLKSPKNKKLKEGNHVKYSNKN